MIFFSKSIGMRNALVFPSRTTGKFLSKFLHLLFIIYVYIRDVRWQPGLKYLIFLISGPIPI